jgi:hypothetical protein
MTKQMADGWCNTIDRDELHRRSLIVQLHVCEEAIETERTIQKPCYVET